MDDDTTTPMWAPIVWGTYFDLPREIIVPGVGGAVYMISGFDEAADDYNDEYGVYWVAGPVDLPVSWDEVAARPRVALGRIPVASVKFAPSVRRPTAIDLRSVGNLPDEYLSRLNVRLVG